MFDLWKKKVIGAIKIAAGVSVRLLPDNTCVFNLTVLKKKKGFINIVTSVQNVKLEEIKNYLPGEVPVILVVDGRGLLHRKIDENVFQGEQLVLSNIIPQANPADFYIQEYRNGNCHYASVIRVQMLTDIINKFSDAGVRVIRSFQGPFVVSALLPFINGDIGGKVTLDHETLEISGDGSISGFKPSEVTDHKVYDIGDDKVASTALISYAAALTLFTNNKPQKELNKVKSISLLEDDWEQKEVFRKSAVLVLSTLFGILLLNTLFFISLYNQNNRLSETAAETQYLLKELQSLKENIRKNEQFVRAAGWDKRTPAWYFADQLALSVPSQINLTQLNVHPMDEKKLKDEKKVLFVYNLIDVRGTCANPKMLNEWLSALKELKWIEQITSQHYQYSDREKIGIFSFKIITHAN